MNDNEYFYMFFITTIFVLVSIVLYFEVNQRQELKDKVKNMEVEAVARGYGHLVIDPQTKEYVFEWKQD